MKIEKPVHAYGILIGHMVTELRREPSGDGTETVTAALTFRRYWPGYFHAIARSIDHREP
jgi:hypothetical protein